MATPTKVLIIAGGLTHERDVSVRSGRRVANILTRAGFVVRITDVNDTLVSTIASFQPNVVWPLVHGSIGEDGSLQTLLESLGIPFVGSASIQSMLASNKPTAKALLASAGMPTPGWFSLPQALFRQVGATNVLSAIEHGVSFPVVIKPTDGGSALGLSTAHNAEELRTAMVDAFAYGQKLMVEQRIDGRDVAVSVVDLGDGPIALPPVEISTDGGRYDYDARYTTDETEYFVPARLESNALADLRAAAIEARVGTPPLVPHRLRHRRGWDVLVHRCQCRTRNDGHIVAPPGGGSGRRLFLRRVLQGGRRLRRLNRRELHKRVAPAPMPKATRAPDPPGSGALSPLRAGNRTL